MPAPRWLPPLTVLVFGLAPFTAFLQDNRSEVTLGEVWPWALATCLPFVVLVVLVGLRRGTASATRWAVALGIALLITLNFTTLRKVMDITPIGDHLVPELIVWVIGTVVAAVLAARLVQRNRSAPMYFLAVGTVMAALPLAQFLAFRAGADAPFETASSAPAASVGGAASGPRPNVYYFLLDAYTRADVLKQKFGYDNSRFIGQLERKGFVVPSRARSDYPLTHLSLPSTLSMDYIVGRDGPERTSAALTVPIIQERNPAVAAFQKLDYRYVQALAGGWVMTACGGLQDLCIEPGRAGSLNFTNTQWALVKLSPLGRALEQWAPEEIATGVATPTQVVDDLAKARVDEPFFLFSHILTAHPAYPFRGPRCARTVDEHARDLRVLGPDYAPIYAQAVRCTNRFVLAAVNRIVERDPDAIILMQGDHGSDVGLDWSKAQWRWDPEQVRDRFKIFDALRVPARCRESIPDDTVMVNTFRIVFACIAGRKPDLLSPRFFIADNKSGEVRPYEDWEEK